MNLCRFSAVLICLFPVVSGTAQQVPIPKPPAAEPRVPVRLDPLTLESEIRSKIDAFFAVLRQSKVEEAYRRLFEDSVLAKDNPDLVKKLEESTTRVLELTGSLGSTEILRIRTAGKTIREVTCLVNGEKRPLRWRFYFYFAEKRWQVLDTTVGTEAAGFFDEEK